MSYVNAQQTRVLLGDFSLSPKLARATAPWNGEMLNTTTLVDASKQFIAGLDTSTVALNGFLDELTFTDETTWTTAQPLTYAPRGLTLGSEVWLVNSLKTQFTPGSQVSGVVSFDLAGQTDGATDIGISLHDLGAETTSSNSSAVDNTASSASGGVGHLHVTDYSGFTNIIVKVQHSTDNFSGSIVDLVTFATVTGATAERVAVTGTVNRYVRAIWTKTGTGSATFQVGFARR